MAYMIGVPKLFLFSLGALLFLSAPASAATSCPQFLVTAGYADLCSPSAWMAFQHGGGDNERVIKRRLHEPRSARPAKIKFKPRRGGQAAAR
jgi:hypothetical protein